MSQEHVLSLSYGKDSLACIEACRLLGYPIDKIVHAEVWATETIPADLPPMVEFKKKADRIIKDRYGIEVEHVCARHTPGHKYGKFTGGGRVYTYEYAFYQTISSSKHGESIRGFPAQIGSWCRHLKFEDNVRKSVLQTDSKGSESRENIRIPDSGIQLVPSTKDESYKFYSGSSVQYLGIAADEPKRIAKHIDRPDIVLPLVDIGWTEADCRKWCEENDLLSPIYTSATRGGCWFCHNQGVEQLRLLRRNYPDLWQILLKWDSDSPITFHADGHTVHDFDKRFKLEDEGWDMSNFRWCMISDDYALQMTWKGLGI